MSHNEQFKVEADALFSDVASTSHAIFGNFALSMGSPDAQQDQVAFLRSMNTIELYRRTPDSKLSLLCRYRMANSRVLAMEKVTIDVRQSLFEPASWVSGAKGARPRVGKRSDLDDDYLEIQTKDLLVLHLPALKFLVLEFDGSVCELGTYSIFNFDEAEELKITGKRFPNQGLLRTISGESSNLNGFSFLADDTLLCWVQLQEVQDLVQANSQPKKQASAVQKKQSALEIKAQRQSSQIWNDHQNDDQAPQGVLASVKLNEKYMHAMSGDPSKASIEQLVKPLELFQLESYGIQYISDIQLIWQRTNQAVSVLVLFKGDIDKMVGTKARYPVTRLAIFQLQVAAEEETKHSGKAQQASTAFQVQLKHVLSIEALPFYAERILKAASSADDYCYLVTPYSLCLVRIESNRVTEIYTSSLGVTLRDKFRTDPQKMFFPKETSNTERSVLENYASQELKLDGGCRVVSLPQHRVLVLTESGQFTMITIRFDQAEIDVAEAVFQKIPSSEKLSASALCFTTAARDNSEDLELFMSSHYHDAVLARLKTVKDSDRIAQLDQEGDEATKRQRLNSMEQLAFVRRKKQTTYYEAIESLDALPIVSPITDITQIPSVAGTELRCGEQTQYSMDFLLGSGNHVKSYLSFAAASIPLIQNDMPLSQLLPAEALQEKSLRLHSVIRFKDKFIFVNYSTASSPVKTSAIHIDPKNKKLVKIGEDRLSLDFDSQTLACLPLENGSLMAQVCPKSISVVDSTLKEQELQTQSHRVALEESEHIVSACHDSKSQALFAIVCSDGVKSVRAYQNQERALVRVFKTTLAEEVGSRASALSITEKDEQSLLLVTTDAQGFAPAELLMFTVSQESLTLVFKCANVNEQPAILPNQLTFEHIGLTHRALTDLSVDISQATHSANLHENINQDYRMFGVSADRVQDAANSIREVKLWFPESEKSAILFLVLQDSSVLLYQSFDTFEEQGSERFRFKLVESLVLVKPKTVPSSESLNEPRLQELVLLESKMAIVLHPCKSFAVFVRQGKPSLVDIGSQQSPGLLSLAPFMTGFLAITQQRNSVKIVKFAPRFDPRTPAVKLSDGYLLKQIPFTDRGIKKIKLFSPSVAKSVPSEERQYVFLATYTHRKSEAVRAGDTGFNGETRAPGIFYQLEVLPLPRGGNTWNEFKEQFLLDKRIVESFPENQVINQLEQVTLESSEGDFRNYLAVASIRIDTSLQKRSAHMPRQDDEGFYSSVLNIFSVVPEQAKLKTCLLENYKRSITCVSSYLGKLIATMKNLKLQDLVFIMYKFNEQQSELVNPQPIPNGVQNLATCISFDGDFVVIGDAYKNLNLLKKCDEEDNKKERHEESGLINFKKVMSNKIEANVIGALSLSKKLALTETDQARYCQGGVMAYQQVIPLTEIQKKMFAVLSASFDGYVRLYKIKETKNLEIVAQINLGDKVLNFLPLQLNTVVGNLADEEELLADLQDRKVAVVTQRNGVLLLSPCSELEHRAQTSLVELISRVLPHRGCLTPMHSHLSPFTPFPEKSSVQERANLNAVNYTKSLYQFYFLTRSQKRNLAHKIGFTVARMEQFLISQRQCSLKAWPTAESTVASTSEVAHKQMSKAADK